MVVAELSYLNKDEALFLQIVDPVKIYQIWGVLNMGKLHQSRSNISDSSKQIERDHNFGSVIYDDGN